jgi:hypothetical protein
VPAMSDLRRLSLRIGGAMAAVASCVLWLGCSQPFQSRLTGVWSVVAPVPERHTSVTIREDGSFDFGAGTEEDSAGARLRKTGDSAVTGEEQHDLIWARYTEDSSAVAVRTSWMIEDAPMSRVALLYAQLREDDTASYVLVQLPTASYPVASLQELVLRRASSAPNAAVQRGRCTAHSDSGASIEFCFAYPRPPVRVPLVVLLTLSDGECEAQLNRWLPFVEEGRCALVVPVMRNDAWFVSQPEIRELDSWAELVRCCTEQAVELFECTSPLLLSESVGGLVGHRLWQTDNRMFARYLAWDAMPVEGGIGGLTNRERPLYLWTSKAAFANVARWAGTMGDWYRSEGFACVEVGEIGESNPRARDDQMLRLLLGDVAHDRY